MDRADIVKGPAIVTFRSQTFYTEDDIIVTPEIGTFKCPSSMFGDSAERLDNIVFNVQFRPESNWVAAKLAVLFPYTNPVYGASVYGATDYDVTIQTLAGQLITIKAGAITAMPQLTLGPNKSPIGQVTITCIGTKDTAWTDEAKRASVASNAFSDTSYDDSTIFTVPYAAAWGAVTPWDDIETEDGWTIDFETPMTDRMNSNQGILDKDIGICAVMAKCTPMNVTETQLLSWLAIQGTGIQRGARLGGGTMYDLIIQGATAGDPHVTVYNCAPKTAGYRFGATVLRSGEIGFVSILKTTTGVKQPLFALTTVSE